MIFILFILLLICPNANATVQVKAIQGQPVAVCTPSDPNTNCGGSGGSGSINPWILNVGVGVGTYGSNSNVGIGTISPLSASLTIKNSNISQDLPTNGTEFLAASTWTSTGYTGGWVAGWDHTPGNTNRLTFTSTGATIGTAYHINIAISNTGCIGDIQFGGITNSTDSHMCSGSSTDTVDQYIVATTTGQFSLSTTNGDAGHYLISVKPLTGSTPSIIGLNSSGTTLWEMRTTPTTNYSLGYQAGQMTSVGTDANKSASFNLAIGYKALKNNVIGRRNTAIGASALENSKIGSINVAIGYQALQSNTTGTNNLALGDSPMQANIDGSNNVGMGASALTSKTTGDNNTAVGASTLSSATSLNYSTAIGYIALQQDTAGYNTALGALALNALSGSSDYENIAVGYQAGLFNPSFSQNTDSVNSVFLGSSSMPQGTADTNEIVIGQGARGYGSNTATLGNASIVTTILRGNVGIGSTAPGAALDVQGTVRGISGGTCTTLYRCQGGVDAGVIQTVSCVLCPASTCVAMNGCF